MMPDEEVVGHVALSLRKAVIASSMVNENEEERVMGDLTQLGAIWSFTITDAKGNRCLVTVQRMPGEDPSREDDNG
jgi:hypothetical protein